MPTDDRKAFGKAIAAVRLAKGFRQKEIVARIPECYREESTYGRVEAGRRKPDRSDAIAIIARGLLVTEVARINGLIGLLGYEGLTQGDIEALGLVPNPVPVDPPPRPPFKAPLLNRILLWGSAGLLVTGAYIAIAGARGNATFVLTTSMLYAGLYVISLFLESAYAQRKSGIRSSATMIFSFMVATSAGALALDGALIKEGSAAALAVSFAVLLVAALAQWLFVRRILSPLAIVEANFQTLTAQAAHLKNTGYFLLIPVLFWLTPFHAVLTLRSLSETGHSTQAQQLLTRQIMIGHRIVALNVESLAGILAVILLLSLGMGAHLLDNLRDRTSLNSFQALFYARALLYFTLSLVCLGWYFYSLGALN